MKILRFYVLVLLAVSGFGAGSAGWSAEGILDYQRFMSQIEVLLTSRTYASPGPTPMSCLDCHGVSTHAAYTAYPLQLGQSRFNFTQTALRIEIESPDTSLVLLKPLDADAGGIPHGLGLKDGGEQWVDTTTDPNYLAILHWIQDALSSDRAQVSRTEAYPNPFRYNTDIVYFLSTPALKVEVNVFTNDGHQVISLSGTNNVGANRVAWNGRDAENEPLGTGVYFYSVKAQFENDTHIRTGKLVYTP